MNRRSTRTILQSAILFSVLVVVYGVYLHGAVASMAVQSEYTLDELMWPLLKYGLISGAPLAPNISRANPAAHVRTPSRCYLSRSCSAR